MCCGFSFSCLFSSVVLYLTFLFDTEVFCNTLRSRHPIHDNTVVTVLGSITKPYIFIHTTSKIKFVL